MNKVTEILRQGENTLVLVNSSDLREFAENLIVDVLENIEKEKNTNRKKYYSTDEVCELLKLERNSLTRYAKYGLLKPRKVGGKNLYCVDEIELLLRNSKA